MTDAAQDGVPEGLLDELEGQDKALEVHERVEQVQGEVRLNQDEVPAVPHVLVVPEADAAAHEHEGDTTAEPRRHEDRLQPEDPELRESQKKPKKKTKPTKTSHGNLKAAPLLTQSKECTDEVAVASKSK